VEASEEAPVTPTGQYQMELADYSGGMDY